MLIHSSTSNLAVVLQADNYLSTVEISADFVSKTVEGERQGRDQVTRMRSHFAAFSAEANF